MRWNADSSAWLNQTPRPVWDQVKDTPEVQAALKEGAWKAKV